MARDNAKIIDRLFVTADKYPQFLQVVSVLVGLVHVTALIMLWILNIKPLAYFNIISISVYILCFFLSKKRKNIYTVFSLFVIEISIFSFLMSVMIKENCFFCAYCTALISFGVITKYMIEIEDTQKGKKFHLGLLLVYLIVLFGLEFELGNLDIGKYSLENQNVINGVVFFNNLCCIACVTIGTVALLNISLDKDAKIRKALDEAEDLRKEAETANAAKSAFLASMSHEIRTPINAVLGMDNMILMESTDENIISYASDIKNAGNTLLSLINDILDTSKIEAGGMTVEPMEYSLASLINDCYSMALFQATEKDLALNITVDPFLPSGLYGDEDRIRQIVINILSNAVKYTRTGHIDFSVGFEKTGDKTLNLIFKVQDTGIGIAPENIDKIFVSFKRVDTNKNRSILGTGLGLSITKQLIDIMGGKVNVDSVVDVGSTFTVTLPQEISRHIAIGEFKPKAAINNMGKITLYAPDAKILVVDDMDVNLRVISGLLKSTKITVDTASSGERCLSMANNNKYDMIFLDHMMPDMDGFETFDRLLALPNTDIRSTPVIMLTANAISGAKEEYLSRGFSDYLSKPVQLPELIDMLVKYLPEEKVSFREKEESKSVKAADDDASQTFEKRFEFLDIASGLLYNGSDEELYLMTISDFYKEDMTEKITSMFETKNYEKYSVYTHSLKSASLAIGAMEVHLKAKDHEKAAKENDIAFVEANFADLMEAYMTLRSNIKGALEK